MYQSYISVFFFLNTEIYDWYTSIFSAILTKGDNFYIFLFASLNYDAFPEWRPFLKVSIASRGANSLFSDWPSVTRKKKDAPSCSTEFSW